MNTAAPDAPDGRRPQTSTRDPEQLRPRLEQWLSDQLGGVTDVAVTNIEIPTSNGMSSETLLFDGAWNGENHRLVVRVAPDPAAVPVFPTYNMHRQFETIAAVHEHCDVPVPEVFWAGDDPAVLGAPFFVMGRIDGEVPPDILPYTFGDNWLFNATRQQQQQLQDASIDVLARLHTIENAPTKFAFLEGNLPSGADSLDRHLKQQEEYYEWVAGDGARSPLIERALRWLRDNRPSASATALSWGDARIGNVLYLDYEPVAVLDWEMAALAPPEIDIGWFIYLHRFFEDLAQRYGFPGMPHFLRRDDVATTYEKLRGVEPRDLDWFTLYGATRHGIVMFRIHRRQVQFGEAVVPDDPDDMIPHRATIESMLSGTYWDRVT